MHPAASIEVRGQDGQLGHGRVRLNVDAGANTPSGAALREAGLQGLSA